MNTKNLLLLPACLLAFSATAQMESEDIETQRCLATRQIKSRVVGDEAPQPGRLGRAPIQVGHLEHEPHVAARRERPGERGDRALRVLALVTAEHVVHEQEHELVVAPAERGAVDLAL